jgi:hypothetical protein
MSGAEIAAEVAAALAEAGEATGAGQLICSLRKRTTTASGDWDVDDEYSISPVTAVQTMRKVRDNLGMTERREKMLLIEATGVAVPAKGDQIAVGVLPEDVDDNTAWDVLGEVETLEPGGVALMYKAMVAS